MLSYGKGLFLTVLIGCSYAYPSGAPSNICGRYVPGGHRNRNTPVANPPQGPYALDVQPLSGGQYRVTLRATGGIPFKGFVIQGMQSNPTWRRFPEGAADIVGTFQPNQNMNSFMPQPSQLRRCASMAGANVITHSDGSPKQTVEVTWTPPPMSSDPSYKLLATVVRDYDTFYVVQSDVINAQGGAASQSSQGTSGGTATGGLPTETAVDTTMSSTGTSDSFLTSDQGPGSFMFPGANSQGGMNGFSGNANTLTDTSATNLAVPPGSVFFSSQDSGFSSPGSAFSSQDSGFSTPGSAFSSQDSGFSQSGDAGFSSQDLGFSMQDSTLSGSGFSSQDSGVSSMSGMNRMPGASSLPDIPSNVNFPRNFPTMSGSASETSLLSNINDTNNFTDPVFTVKGSQMNLGINFIGAPKQNNSTDILSNFTDTSNSVLFSNTVKGTELMTDQSLTTINISSELAMNPPIALEMFGVTTMAPKQIATQPPNATKGSDSANMSNTVQSTDSAPFQSSSTFHPMIDSSSLDPFWDNSSFDPFFISTTADPFRNSSIVSSLLPLNFSKPSNKTDIFVQPSTFVPFKSPPSENQLEYPNTAIPFQEANTVIPFQAPSKPKPINIPLPPDSLILAVLTTTSSPLLNLTTARSFNPQPSSSSTDLPSIFEQPQPFKPFLFQPPVTLESVNIESNNSSKPMSFGSTLDSLNVTVSDLSPNRPDSINFTVNDVPLNISDSINFTVTDVPLNMPDSINVRGNDLPLNMPDSINFTANDLLLGLITDTVDTSAKFPAGTFSDTILINPTATEVPLESVATYDPLEPPPPIFVPEIFPSPESIVLTNKSVTDSVTVPVTRPVASIDLPIRIDSPTINTLPTGDVRVVLRSPPTSTEGLGSFISESISSSSSSSLPAFEVVSTSLSDVMGSEDLSGGSASDVLSSNSMRLPTLRVEPIVTVINVPVPSGQIAAVLNFTRDAGATVPTGSPPIPPGTGSFVTIGRPLGQFGGQTGAFGTSTFGQQSQFGTPTFGRPNTFGGRSPFPSRGPASFGGQTQFGGAFSGPSGTGSGAGTFGFQQFARPMPSGFVEQSSQSGGAGTQFGGSAGPQFGGQGPSFIGQGAVRQFRFRPQGSQLQTFRFQPQPGQFTTFRFGSQPGQFSGAGSFMTSGQGQGQAGTSFSSQTLGMGGSGSPQTFGAGGSGSPQTFGAGGSGSPFLTPVGV